MEGNKGDRMCTWEQTKEGTSEWNYMGNINERVGFQTLEPDRFGFKV